MGEGGKGAKKYRRFKSPKENSYKINRDHTFSRTLRLFVTGRKRRSKNNHVLDENDSRPLGLKKRTEIEGQGSSLLNPY